MNTQWQDFLASHKGQMAENGDTLFGNSLPSSNCWKTDLSVLGILRISGADKQTFLQGQLTSDTRNISAEQGQLTSYCTPKGRMLASMRIVQLADDWLMLLPRSRLGAVQKRLQMFVMRSDVRLEDVSDTLACIGVQGDCLDHTDGLPAMPEQTGQTRSTDNLVMLRVEGASPRFMIIGENDACQTVWNALDVAESADTSAWRLQDIRFAVPTVYEETVEAFIPQMTNLQLLDAVSFTKGCYTGQEVVARMQYLGKLKRRMYPVSFNSETEIVRGTEIVSPDSQSGQGAGKLVDVVKTGDNQYEALAVIEISSMEQGDLHLLNDDGPLLNVHTPPYSFEVDET